VKGKKREKGQAISINSHRGTFGLIPPVINEEKRGKEGEKKGRDAD